MHRFRHLQLRYRISAKRFCTDLQETAQLTSYYPCIYARFCRASKVHRFVLTQVELGNNDLVKPVRTECPACEHNDLGIRTCSADACMSFQGKGNRSTPLPTLYGDLFVANDLSKVEIMADKKYLPKNSEDCDGVFRAADSAYTSGTNYHQGIFGSICKHGVPGDFMFLCHGKEAYIYANTVLQKQVAKLGLGRLLFKYDLACKFVTYLKVSLMLAVFQVVSL